ncbi:gamma-tubulin complex component protein [Dimargaris cristalligena]|uniref:Spindle pole body component n=1 Tax=Dimargaris cristalligena TaxID=215637 RepID=A0A4P9ZSV5_9FUNG|nr:gamma-tubulin complex component protein [Dimargaris cristalligena]|eukprot:RKP36278.1 gamma-tubulin complex component protein [Dimargaris cristalligena]
MLHELLFALAGHPGEVFVKTKDRLQVSPHFPFLHPSETAALNEILQVANAYYELTEFCSHAPSNPPIAASTSDPATPSLYFTTLQRAVKEIVLQPYEGHIVDLEARILREEEYARSATPLTYIRSETEPYQVLFANTLALVGQVKSAYANAPDTPSPVPDYRGARLLDAIRSACNSGIPEVASAMRRIYHHCCRVFWNHTMAWMVYGTLVDPSQEFAVKLAAPGGIPGPTEVGGGGGGGGGGGTRETQSTDNQWRHRYCIDPSRLPRHIPDAVTQAILFVGKVVNMFQREGHTSGPTGTLAPYSVESQRHLGLLQGLVDQSVFLNDEVRCLPVFTEIRNDVTRWLWRDLRIGIHIQTALQDFRGFYLLGQGDFWGNLLEVLDKWSFQPAGGSEATPSLPQTKVTTFTHLRRDRELKSLLPHAAIGTELENNPTLALFALRVHSSNPGGPSTSSESTDPRHPLYFYHQHRLPLQLTYLIRWPLDLLLTYDSDLVGYQRIFVYLLVLRRVQARSHRVCAQICRYGRGLRSGAGHSGPSPVLSLIYQLRWLMLQWLDGLTAHFQTDIIDYAYRTFLRTVYAPNPTSSPTPGSDAEDTDIFGHTARRSACDSGSEMASPRSPRAAMTSSPTNPASLTHPDQFLDLNDFQILHRNFLNYIERGLLMRSRPLSDAIQGALEACESICGVCERWMSLRGQPTRRAPAGQKALQEFHAMSATETDIYKSLQGLQKVS